MGARTLHRENIQVVAELTETGRVEFDDRHVVALSTQAFGHIGADFSGSDHDHSHETCLAPSDPDWSDGRIEGARTELEHCFLGDLRVDRNVPLLRRDPFDFLDWFRIYGPMTLYAALVGFFVYLAS